MDKDQLQLPLAGPGRLQGLYVFQLGHLWGQSWGPLLQYNLIQRPPYGLHAFKMMGSCGTYTAPKRQATDIVN